MQAFFESFFKKLKKYFFQTIKTTWKILINRGWKHKIMLAFTQFTCYSDYDNTMT